MYTPVYFDQSDVFPYQPISPIWMIIYASLSFILFTKLNQIFVLKTNWLQENTLLSFIHSCISSVLAIICILRTPEMYKDPISHSNHFNYATLAFTMGYFLYDFIDCLKNATSKIYAILFHHIIALAFIFYVLYYNRIIGYGIYGLTIEVNSIFLHARRLLRWYSSLLKSRYYYDLLKIFIDIGNYITIIIFRFGIIIFSSHGAYINRYRVHPIVFGFLIICILAMGILNGVLLYRLIKNQLREKSKIKRNKPSEDKVLMTDNHVLLPS